MSHVFKSAGKHNNYYNRQETQMSHVFLSRPGSITIIIDGKHRCRMCLSWPGSITIIMDKKHRCRMCLSWPGSITIIIDGETQMSHVFKLTGKHNNYYG